jgi:hypothetical protein
MANEAFAKAVVEIAATEAGKMVESMVKEAPDVLTKLDATKAEASAKRILTQDAYSMSLRIWSGVIGLSTIVLVDPAVQEAITQFVSANIPVKYLPLVSAVLSSMLAFLSKALDTRPVRSKD